MCLVWKYWEYNKSYERGSKKCPLEVLSIFTFGIVGWRVGKIAADFYPQLLKNRLLQPVYLLRIVTQLVEMLACFLPCSGVTDKWHLSRSFYAGPLKWRENNGAKMMSWSRKKFPVLVSETKLLPWTKKKNHPRDSRREEHCSTCDIMLDQARSAQGKVAESRRSDLPCADRAWSSMISHVEQRSSSRESRWWFFFLSRVVVKVTLPCFKSLTAADLSQIKKTILIGFSISRDP